MSYRLVCASLLAALCQVATAADPRDEQRLRSIEERLQRVESGTRAAPDTPAAGARQVTSNAFNPAISLILDGKYAGLSRDPSTYGIAGFSVDPEVLEVEEGFYLDGTELTLSANVDNKFYSQFTAGFHHGEVEIEEAFFETLALGHGFTARGGRFLSGIGYLNSIHAHAWDFTDAPLPYRAMIGRHNFGDDGVQLRWVAPTDFLLELGAEILRGESFPSGGAARSGKGTKTGFIRVGGDVGASNAWRVGLSRLTGDAEGRESGDEDALDSFTGDVDLSIVDFVWKWAPNGNARERNFKFQAEYFQREENGEYALDELDPAAFAFQGKQKGWYAQAIYQFMPRWRAGLRYATADAGAAPADFAGTVLDAEGYKPKATSLMLDFSNSEFSRFRVQYTRDESRADGRDNQYYVQYVMSLGPHGAHSF